MNCTKCSAPMTAVMLFTSTFYECACEQKPNNTASFTQVLCEVAKEYLTKERIVPIVPKEQEIVSTETKQAFKVGDIVLIPRPGDVGIPADQEGYEYKVLDNGAVKSMKTQNSWSYHPDNSWTHLITPIVPQEQYLTKVSEFTIGCLVEFKVEGIGTEPYKGAKVIALDSRGIATLLRTNGLKTEHWWDLEKDFKLFINKETN